MIQVDLSVVFSTTDCVHFTSFSDFSNFVDDYALGTENRRISGSRTEHAVV